MSWAVRVTGGGRTGTGAVVSDRLVLTCAHVVVDQDEVDVRDDSGETMTCRVVEADRRLDVAVLTPAAESDRFDRAALVVPRAFWRGVRLPDDRAEVALCTEDSATPRMLRVEVRRAGERAQRVQFGVRDDREGVRHGYSGGPVIEPDWRSTPRLIGIVRARDELSVDALDNAGSGWLVPTERIAERFEAIAALVEAPVERTAQWGRHWEPRSRGVVRTGDRGFFFTGREAAYEAVRGHLAGGDGLMIVTGRRGAGKSAVLAHVIALSCPRYLALLGEEAQEAVGALRRLPAPVDAAVMARGLTAEAVAQEVAEQLGLGPCSPDEVVQALLTERPGAAVVVDAVDEAADPAALLREFVIPATQAGARVAIGSLVGAVSPLVPDDSHWCDVSTDDAGAVITAYVVRRLCAQSDYDHETAQVVAAAVAQRADGLFIAAELMARTLAGQPPIDTKQVGWQERVPTDLTDAFREYLGRFGGDLERVLAVLHPLACARGVGLTLGPAWLASANALREEAVEPIQDGDLRRVCRKEAADYLIQSTRGEWRLYHEGLAEAIRLLVARERVRRSGAVPTPQAIASQRDEAARRFVDALLGLLPEDWDAGLGSYARVDGYVLRHLPGHLADLGRTDELYRPGLLLAADREALQRAFVLASVTTPAGAEAARIAVVHALAQSAATPAHRAAALVMALRRQGEADLAERVRRALGAGLPYELIAGLPLPPVVSSISCAHVNGTQGLAVVDDDGAPLVISGGSDGALRSWWLDGRPGPLTVSDIHGAEIQAVEVIEVGGRPLIVSGAQDGALRSCWLDGRPGPLTALDAHTEAVAGLAFLHVGDVPVLVSYGLDGAVQLWPLDREPSEPILLAVQGPGFGALATVDVGGVPLVVTGDIYGALRSWWLDGSPGPLDQPEAHGEVVTALVSIEVDGEPVIVSGGLGGKVRNWRLDGSPGPMGELTSALIADLTVARLDDGPVVVSGGFNGVLRSWWPDGRPGPLSQPGAHSDAITSMAVVGEGDASLLVTGGSAGTLRTWRLVAGGAARSPSSGDMNWIKSLAVTDVDGSPLVISGGSLGALRSWRLDGSPGPLMLSNAHDDEITGLAVVDLPRGTLVVAAAVDGVLSSWWLDGREGPFSVRGPRRDELSGLAAVEFKGSLVFVSGGPDGALRSWRLGGRRGPLTTPESEHAVTAIAAADLGGGPVIISGDSAGDLRSWHLDGSPGPFTVPQAHREQIRSITALLVDGSPLVISGADDGALRSWWLDGRPGPLGSPEPGEWISAVAVLTLDGEPLIASGNGGVRTWRIDGAPGPLIEPDAHPGGVEALVPLEVDGVTLMISGGGDGSIVAHRLVYEYAPAVSGRATGTRAAA